MQTLVRQPDRSRRCSARIPRATWSTRSAIFVAERGRVPGRRVSLRRNRELGRAPRVGAYPVARRSQSRRPQRLPAMARRRRQARAARKISCRPRPTRACSSWRRTWSCSAFVLPWAVMPFSSALILADLNVGILYMTAVTALTVVGVLMAGWASNDKWSLIGGIRSAAQIVSYEIPAGLSIFPVVLMTGTLSMQGIIRAQGWAPHHWFLFANPFCFSRRTSCSSRRWPKATARRSICPKPSPNWWPASRPSTAGCATCFSSWRSGATCSSSARIITTLFLGGWQFPHVSDNRGRDERACSSSPSTSRCCSWCSSRCGCAATLPRVRIDQLMSLCWKYFVPIAFVNMIGTAVWVAIWPDGNPVSGLCDVRAGRRRSRFCSSGGSCTMCAARRWSCTCSPTI